MLLSSITGGCGSWLGPPVKVDLSTPKSAALAYLKAVQAGDRRTAQAACFGTSEQMRWVDGRVTLVDGMRQFDNVLYAKYGNVTSQVHTDMHDSLLQLADIWVTAISDGQVSGDEEKARIDPARNGFFTHAVSPIYVEHRKEGVESRSGADLCGLGVQPDDYARISADHKQWKEFGDIFLDVAPLRPRWQDYRSADAAAWAAIPSGERRCAKARRSD